MTPLSVRLAARVVAGAVVLELPSGAIALVGRFSRCPLCGAPAFRGFSCPR